jgi:quercetin dioxygenase-like cupin family protein
VWWLVNPREMKDITDGGFLELVSEFEVAGGGLVDPHSHPTHEFYYVTSGRGIMTIAGEDREIRQGDLVHIPPNEVHSLRPVSDHAPIHCFCFAVGVRDSGPVDYTSH